MVKMNEVPRSIDANYAVWSADTDITLTNVPWDNNYRDIVKFDNQAKLNAYIDTRQTTNVQIHNASEARVEGRPVRLEIPMSQAYGYNYVRVANKRQVPTNNEAISYYYFITGIEYVNAGVTLFYVQLDIWQTFGQRVTFGNCYVEQGHIGMANSLAFNGYGRDYLTLSEGLDTGGDLRIIREYTREVMSPTACNILVIMNTNPEKDWGTQEDPTLDTSKGGRVLGTPSGASYYIFETLSDFEQFASALSIAPWIAQGIMSITAIPQLRPMGYKLKKVTIPHTEANVYQLDNNPTQYGRGRYYSILEAWRNSSDIYDRIPERYRKLRKLFTYPYMAIEMTFNNGAPIVVKPEQWQSPHADIAVKTNFVAPGQRTVAYPRKYNGDPNADEIRSSNPDGTYEYYNDGGDYLEMSTFVANFPTFAIVNNAGTLALANIAHSLAQQYKAADWSQQKALNSADVGYDQASAGISNSNYQNALSQGQASAQTGIANDADVQRAILGAGTSIGGGLATGGPAGAAGGAISAISGAAGTAVGIGARNRSTATSNAYSGASQAGNAGTASYMRDTNYALSQYAARGDYQQSIAAINAKVADTAMTPPFTAGQAGGDSFNFVFGGVKLFVRWKMVAQAQLRAIGEYWLRYGYAVRQFVKPPASLMVMTNFTYWKMSETYIVSSSVPEGMKQSIRGIFEKGVTVWKDPAKIGVIDRADNEALTGVTL